MSITTGSIKNYQYNSSRLEEVLDSNLSELYFPKGSFIQTIDDFFAFYDNIKEDIDWDNNTLSHQYLVDQAIDLTYGEVIIYTENDHLYKWNQIKEIVSESDMLRYQIEDLEITNNQLNEQISYLNDNIVDLQNEIKTMANSLGLNPSDVGANQFILSSQELDLGKVIGEGTASADITIFNVNFIDNIEYLGIPADNGADGFSLIYYQEIGGPVKLRVQKTYSNEISSFNTNISISDQREQLSEVIIPIYLLTGKIWKFEGSDPFDLPSDWEIDPFDLYELGNSYIELTNDCILYNNNNILDSDSKYNIDIKYAVWSEDPGWQTKLVLGEWEQYLESEQFKEYKIKSFIAATGNSDDFKLEVKNLYGGMETKIRIQWIKLWKEE